MEGATHKQVLDLIHGNSMGYFPCRSGVNMEELICSGEELVLTMLLGQLWDIEQEFGMFRTFKIIWDAYIGLFLIFQITGIFGIF